jgi:hypothetical protein
MHPLSDYLIVLNELAPNARLGWGLGELGYGLHLRFVLPAGKHEAFLAFSHSGLNVKAVEVEIYPNGSVTNVSTPEELKACLKEVLS